MSLRASAKEVFLTHAQQGFPLSFSEMARRSVDLLGEPVSFYTIREWSTRDGWLSQTEVSEHYDSDAQTKILLIKVFDRLYEGGKDGDIASNATSITSLLSNASRMLIVEFQEEVRDARDFLFSHLENGIGTIRATHQSSMVRSWVALKRYIEEDLMYNEDLIYDADELILHGSETD